MVRARGGGGAQATPPPGVSRSDAQHPPMAGNMQGSNTPAARGSAQPAAQLDPDALARFARIEDIVDLIRAHRDVKLLVDVETGLRLVRYSPGRIEFEPTAKAPPDLAQRLGSRLQAWTGSRWAVIIANETGLPTIAETRDAAEIALKKEAETHPLVQAAFAAFPKAKIVSVRTDAELEVEASTQALAIVEDEWDPFDED